MSDNELEVKGAASLDAFHRLVDSLVQQHGTVCFSWRLGETPDPTQKSLANIWLRQCASHYLEKHPSQISESDIEGMKRSAKARFYHETNADWMVIVLKDPMAPTKERKEYRSIAHMKKHELTQFMNWLQGYVANDGLVLESNSKEHKDAIGK